MIDDELYAKFLRSQIISPEEERQAKRII